MTTGPHIGLMLARRLRHGTNSKLIYSQRLRSSGNIYSVIIVLEIQFVRHLSVKIASAIPALN